MQLDNEKKWEKEKKDKKQALSNQNLINKKPKLLEKANDIDLPPFSLPASLLIQSEKPSFKKINGH